ncbi:protein DEK [Dermacentor silvarum]|uniref:protein DEK n=1 Tax=Dermacentor silvarum TaxID=543639 RepID=UPI00189B4121|nr:protein DEK [Dermacentor silvarum]
MSESESVPVENNVRKAASEEKAPADDKQDDGNSAAEERSHDEEPKLGLLYQALELSGSRQRKKVERLDVSFRTAARERPPPEQGKGTPLGDCPRIEHNIKRERSESLKGLHRLLFGHPGAPSEIKKNLRKFSGFPFEKDSAEYVKREKMVAKLKKTAHKHLLGMLDLEKSGTVEEWTDRILNFLLKPFDNKKPLPATKNRKRKSMTHASAGKGQAKKRKTVNPKAEKGKASRKRPAKRTSTPAKRRKVAKKEESDEDDESDEKEVRNDGARIAIEGVVIDNQNVSSRRRRGVR